MKILHICYEYPPVGGGGGEACRRIAEQTAQRDVSAVVLTSWFRGLPKVERQANLEVRRLFCFRSRDYQSTIFEMFLYLIIALPVAVYLQASRSFDLVHVHFAVPCGPIGFVLHKLFGVKYIMTLQGGDVPSFVPAQTGGAFSVIKPLTVPIWRNASRIFAVSAGLAHMAERDYPGVTVDVIPNGVDDVFFLGRFRDERCDTGIAFVGRLADQKQVDVLLLALAKLIDRNEWEAHVAGDGPLAAQLEELARSQRLTSRVTFHGWLKQEQLLDVLARADIFVLPSSAEGLPLAALQAMAAGLLVVGSDVTGIRDLIDHGKTGYLFPNRDVAALAGLLGDLLSDRATLRTMQERAASEADRYRWSRIADGYLIAYNSLVPSVEASC
ncbi:MAG: glycosyltransferase [Desulfomonile tiedjei]|nr:glycosyltransferase [Desulfomonile tiedjei]